MKLTFTRHFTIFSEKTESGVSIPYPSISIHAVKQVTAEDEGVDMKEIDGLLNEMTVMLGRWSLYTRFLAETCNVCFINTSPNRLV